MAGTQSRGSGTGAGSGSGSADDSAALWGPPGQAGQGGGQIDQPGAGATASPGPPPATPVAGRTLGTPPSTSPILLGAQAGAGGPALEALDGQGQVWEFDLGNRPTAPTPADDPGAGDISGWATDLDQPDGWVDEGGTAAPVSSRRRKMFMTAAAVLVAVLAGLSLPGLLSDDPEPAGDTIVLGRHLAAPVSLNLPEGAVATADASYVGVQFAEGGWVLVTVPEQIIQPGGMRAPMPSDPAGWLRQHPDVFVSGVRSVQVDGRTATQIDYRRSSMAEPKSQYARLALFCGWRDGDTNVYRSGNRSSSRECTQITNDARVRATFIPVDGRMLLVEAVWRPYGQWGWRMPTSLKNSYNDLLAGLSPRVEGK